jgi:hypothetical protein
LEKLMKNFKSIAACFGLAISMVGLTATSALSVPTIYTIAGNNFDGTFTLDLTGDGSLEYTSEFLFVSTQPGYTGVWTQGIDDGDCHVRDQPGGPSTLQCQVWDDAGPFATGNVLMLPGNGGFSLGNGQNVDLFHPDDDNYFSPNTTITVIDVTDGLTTYTIAGNNFDGTFTLDLTGDGSLEYTSEFLFVSTQPGYTGVWTQGIDDGDCHVRDQPGGPSTLQCQV